MMNKQFSILLTLAILFSFGCKTNHEFHELKDKKGNLMLVKKEFKNKIEFGDCFILDNNIQKYFILITSENLDPYVSFIPIDVSRFKKIDENSVKELYVTYYSRKTGLIDLISDGEIPYGGFEIFFERDNLEDLNSFISDIDFLFGINLDRNKVVDEYGGTYLDTSIHETINHCIDYKNRIRFNQYFINIPLENLCKE